MRAAEQQPGVDDNAYWTQPPPAPDTDGVVDVEFHVLIWKVGPVDTVTGCAEISISVQYEWSDPRMVGWSDELPPKLWGPRFYLSNMLGDVTEKRFLFNLTDAAAGRLERGISFIGAFGPLPPSLQSVS
jgi:hypothetical protein